MSLQLPSGVYSFKLVINDHAQGRHSNQCHRAMALVNFLVWKYQKSREVSYFSRFIIKNLKVAWLIFTPFGALDHAQMPLHKRK